MDHLSEEQRAVYETLSAEAAAAQKAAKLEILALISESVETAVARSMDSVRSSFSKSVSDMRVYADGVESTLTQSMEDLRAQMGLAANDSEQRDVLPEGDAETGPHGRRGSSIPRRSGAGAAGPYVPPPARGNRPIRNSVRAPRSFDIDDEHDSPHRYRTPRVDMPKFDGENPKLWQIRCEDYFELYDTSPRVWVKLSAMQFTGPAARRLSAVQSQLRKFTWTEFCQEIVDRFGKNEHQSLIRKLYKLVQTGTVDEYVSGPWITHPEYPICIQFTIP
jgi:hypothetical protein